MKVIKRSGESEDVSFDKVLNRMKNITSMFDNGLDVDIYDIAQKVCSRIYNNVSTAELDELAANICSSLIIDNPDYGKMASSIIVSNHHKNTSPSFSETISILYSNKDVYNNENPLISHELYEVVQKYKEKLNSYIDYSRDYNFDYFGFKTLERAYLMKIGNKVIERPQHMFMRVALGIHGNDIKDALQTYDMMSNKLFIHATPTLFNSGTPRPQLSSCFLLSSEDSIDGIYDTLKECAKISKYAGGIGMNIHTIRSKGSRIRGTNGNSTGIIPMLRVFNNTARYVNQCFTPDTLVYSSDGMKRMDEVWIDDELITIDGSLKKVNFISINKVKDESMLKIYTDAIEVPLKCTKVHEIGVYENDRVVFKAASELVVGDMMYYPPGTYFNNNELLNCKDGGKITKINYIDTYNYTGEVFDFNMMDNHNYLTSHGIVHNSGKRNGSIAVYLEPWHADIENFLELRKPHGNDEERTRDLFLALWIPDLFMERVKDNKTWSLMCPDVCQHLSDVYGDDFKELYEKYENEGKFIKQVPAQKIWFKILESQIESGQPYLLFKDACNTKSNQKNLGTIKSSNLCVAPETRILTSTGYYPISSLKDKNVEVWNGKTFSKTMVKQTGQMQKLIKLQFSNGMEVRCTPYHKLYIETDDANQVVIEAKDAVIGTKLIKYDLPCINVEANKMENAYTLGLNKYKFEVPSDCNMYSKLEWLSGYLDGYGILDDNKIEISSKNTLFLQDVLLMLQTLGIVSMIEDYKLTIDHVNVMKLVKLGLCTKLMNSIIEVPLDMTKYMDITITGIIDNDDYDDTYCFNEPLEHKGIFNGVIMGNCTEIVEYTDKDETSVCNLASIALPSFVEYTEENKPFFNFEKLHQITKVITKNLNKVIDINYYPVEKARRSNLRHRPIGIGVQGLADLFVLMRFPFESVSASDLNKNIFETIYHGALEASMEISKKRQEHILEYIHINDQNEKSKLHDYIKFNEFENDCMYSKYPGSYVTFEGSPASKGILQFDMWNIKPSDRYDWDTLKKDIQTYGLRNSLLVAPMPTASTSQILGFNECFEAFTSNIYKRKTLAGEFILVNKYLIEDLLKMGIWNKDLKDKIIINDGSIQGIDEIPEDLRELYKTVWEIKQKTVIDMAADRGAFICQSQSMNLFIEDPDFKKLTSMHFYSWQKGLKTGIYYLRSKPKAQAQKFTIDPNLNKFANLKKEKEKIVCTDEVCTVCSA